LREEPYFNYREENMTEPTKYSFDTVIFDMDGVITTTAIVHGVAWKETFDEYLRLREERDGEPFREFTHEGDYLPYVDGKPRYIGVKSFIESRGISIPHGDPGDGPEKETHCGLGNRKNVKLLEILKRDGAGVYEPAVALVEDLKAKGIRVGVASSSKNCELILTAAKVVELFETRVDGIVSAEMGLKGKPYGDIFTNATARLGGTPARAIVVEDAVSGVQAGQDGKFGLVLGVARENNEQELAENGADVVVTDFSYVDTDQLDKWFREKNGN